MHTTFTKDFGFTLIEMVVTVALVGILASVIVPIAQMEIQRSKEQELKKSLSEIRTAIDAFKKVGDDMHIARNAITTGYPESLEQLVKGVIDIKDPNGKKIFFLRRVPRDPMNSNPDLMPEQTWGKRAYSSEADDPKAGSDVYDVYSLSEKIGLDGQAYRDW